MQLIENNVNSFYGAHPTHVTLEVTIAIIPLRELDFLSLECTPYLNVHWFLWIQVEPLMDSRVEEVSYVDSKCNSSCRARTMDSIHCLVLLVH